MRLCLDCGADIGPRPGTRKRCPGCAYKHTLALLNNAWLTERNRSRDGGPATDHHVCRECGVPFVTKQKYHPYKAPLCECCRKKYIQRPRRYYKTLNLESRGRSAQKVNVCHFWHTAKKMAVDRGDSESLFLDSAAMERVVGGNLSGCYDFNKDRQGEYEALLRSGDLCEFFWRIEWLAIKEFNPTFWPWELWPRRSGKRMLAERERLEEWVLKRAAWIRRFHARTPGLCGTYDAWKIKEWELR